MAQASLNKDIRYLNKDFVQFRNALIDFAKTYYPNTYNDFNESTIGMMFMEMSAYVGDVLSYYLDSNLKESMILHADEYKNILYHAQSRGYVPKMSVPSSVMIDVYQEIPSTGINGEDIDFRYALKIDSGMTMKSTQYPDIEFRTTDMIDFSNYSTANFTAHRHSQNGNYIQTYVLKKSIPAVAGNVASLDFIFGAAESFAKLTIPYTDIIEILSVVDSNGNPWYEVGYLAQDTILYDELNDDNAYVSDSSIGTTTMQESTTSSQPAQFLLKMKRAARRYIVRRALNGETELQFGAGISSYPDQILIPNPETSKYNSQVTFTDIANSFVNSRTYGIAPVNTTLTVTFTRGGGLKSNVPQNDITSIQNVSYLKVPADFASAADRTIYARAQSSLAVSNLQPAVGGRDAETADEIRQNAMAYYAAQDRCVTAKDYTIRVLSMPEKYGSISKVFVKKDSGNNAVDIYVLGYNNQKQLTPMSTSAKQNLITYLNQYRELTTAINIKDGFIVNIELKFDILVHPKYNKNDVILRCIDAIKSYFNIDYWQINQPIILSEIYNFLDGIDGVRTVSSVEITNKYSTIGINDYSNNYYYIKGATIDDIIYTSQDPMIFEIKYPNVDIIGITR